MPIGYCDYVGRDMAKSIPVRIVSDINFYNDKRTDWGREGAISSSRHIRFALYNYQIKKPVELSWLMHGCRARLHSRSFRW